MGLWKLVKRATQTLADAFDLSGGLNSAVLAARCVELREETARLEGLLQERDALIARLQSGRTVKEDRRSHWSAVFTGEAAASEPSEASVSHEPANGQPTGR